MTLSAGTATDLSIEPFAPAHLDGALRLSRQAGWPHRKADWELGLAVSAGVAALADGRVVGTALCTRFGDVALLNMIIVDTALRGHGLGRRLMEAAMALAPGCEMRLVATSEGLPLYEKLGFRASGEVLQHQGLARTGTPERPVWSGTPDDAGRLAGIDSAASGLARRPLLARIADQGEVLLAEGGFALLRDFGRGRVLGPVVARDSATARALITEGARRTAGTFLRIDLPGDTGLAGHVTALGLARAGGGTAMARNPAPRTKGDYTTFALVSQALG